MAQSSDYMAVERSRPMTREEKKVILASSAGTIFEWYDFYLYGSLVTIIGAQFFSGYPSESTRNVFALLAFAAGFLVRPFGALVFGSLGDIVGRKYTFLMTITIMGLSTFLVGLLPNYEAWGTAAPVILIALRMLQGLALGGEYGGAAVYVAEHAPQNRRGYYTSFIQTTATLGLLLSLIVILICQNIFATYDSVPKVVAGVTQLNADGTPVMVKYFDYWGWRVPFLLSAILLIISLYIRLQMQESPQFQRIKAEGMTSKTPLRETFGTWRNGKWAIIALLGLTAGQAVVWYSGQFYALFFLQNIAKVDGYTANVMVAWSLILGTAGFIFFGSLSDRIGRKIIILGGCALAAATYFTVFPMLMKAANPVLHAAQQTEVTVVADPENCSFQFNPTGTLKFTNSCDIAKALLQRSAVNSATVDAPAGTIATVKIGDKEIAAYDLLANGTAISDAKAALDEVKKGIEANALTALTDAEKALTGAKAAADTAAKALATAEAGTDEAKKTEAKTKSDAAAAAVAPVQAALDAARAAIPADVLAKYDAAVATVTKESGVAGAFTKAVNDALAGVGYPIDAAKNTEIVKITSTGIGAFFDIFSGQKLAIVAILTYLVLLVTMVYGPVAAALVELFPTRIRYSGLSLPYHIGNGWFGGLLPATVFAISAQTGNAYSGLWYPIIVAVMTVIIGAIFVPNGTHKKNIFADDLK